MTAIKRHYRASHPLDFLIYSHRAAANRGYPVLFCYKPRIPRSMLVLRESRRYPWQTRCLRQSKAKLTEPSHTGVDDYRNLQIPL